ncbi:pentatricopeptide repeat-containing protein At5g08305-like [Dioscorea cayenensis subsp. rotundata]|uniref:Pentatricopeptide repeat-containing protein At5g08305-like n=1 Tax=Dioscorea cayennensis subsp. rotundata TaxID=55577 RepID=A0AB40BQ67_DIOCR|nr:pentatricopeptide repeat-containing protein At5g08305-like [Dioscorea cayenensis subsp. rotundata]
MTQFLSRLTSLLSQCKTMKELKQIHAQVTIAGHSSDNHIISKLLMFSTTSGPRNTDYSFKLFSLVSSPGTFFYNTIIRAFSASKNPARVFSLYNQMLLAGLFPDHYSFPFLTKACANLASLPSRNFSSLGVFDAMCVRNLVSWNTMVDGYAKCGDLVAARNVFDGMLVRDVMSWSALIDGYVKGGEFRKADGMKANAVALVSVLCACSGLRDLDEGRRVHRYIKDNGVCLTIQLSTSLVDMYAKCGSITEALAVFRVVPVVETDVLIWNAIIGGLVRHGRSKHSLAFFEEMQVAGVQPDKITYSYLYSACTNGGLVEDAQRFRNLLKAQRMAVHVEHCASRVDVLRRSGRVVRRLM